MLKLQQPDLFRRRIGGVLVALCAIGVAGAVYAATPSPQAGGDKSPSGHYTLKVDVAMGGRADVMHFTSCLRPGQYTELSGTAAKGLSWKGRFAVSPAAGGPGGQLEISAQVDTRFDRGHGNVRTQSAKPIVRTMPGQKATIVFGQVVDGGKFNVDKAEDNTIKIDVTPSPGCVAGTVASAKPALTPAIDQPSGSIRDVAKMVASRGGFFLVNPQVLDDHKTLAGNFYDIPAPNALQFIASQSGMMVQFDGTRVTFTPK